MMWESGGLPGASINYPVYFGLGNHDGRDASATGAQAMWNYQINRLGGLHMDRNSAGCLVGIDSLCIDEGALGGSINYSWDWEGVHFVQLNTWAGDTQNLYAPPLGSDGVTWLTNDLQHYVGDSGRPVVLIQHYDLKADSKYWTSDQISTFISTIKKYNVIAMFVGHSHALGIQTWIKGTNQNSANTTSGTSLGTTLDTFVDGSGGDCEINGDRNTFTNYPDDNSTVPFTKATFCAHARSDFLSVHVTDKYLEVTANSWKDTVTLYVNGADMGMITPGYLATNGTCRKRIGTVYNAVPSSQATVAVDNTNHNFTVTNLTGKTMGGSFAIAVPNPAAESGNGTLTQMDFVDSCAPSAGTAFRLVSESGLGVLPAAVPFNSNGPISSTGITLYQLNDQFILSQTVPVVGASPVQLTLDTLSQNATDFTVTVDPPSDFISSKWLHVTTDKSTTPATLTLTADVLPSYPILYQTLAITPQNSTMPGLHVTVLLENPAFQATSSSQGAQIKTFGNTQTLPVNFAITVGNPVSLDVTSPQYPSPGKRYTYRNWSDGGAQAHKVLVPLTGLTLGVGFDTAYQITTSASGNGSIDINPSSTDGYYPAGDTKVTAMPAQGNYFLGFGGVLAGITKTLAHFDLNQLANITAMFAPAITWSNPADILFGIALSAAQLNATSPIPGSFVYSPPAGAVPPVGDGQTLSARFTPADNTQPATTATVTINVKPAGAATLILTKTLARDSHNNVVATVTIANTGSAAATNVVLATAKIATTNGTPLPQSLPDIPAGGSIQTTVTFAGTVGAQGAGSSLTLGGTYSGGTFNSAARIVLP